MARVSKVDPCLICDMVPCECNKPAPKVAKVRTPRVKPVVNVEDSRITTPAPVAPSKPARPNMLAAMKERAASPTAPPTTAPVTVPVADPADETFRSAIKALWPILHPQERAKWPWAKPDLTDRRAAWKARVKG